MKDAAPANKAADLNTGAAWLVSGDLEKIPESIRPCIAECRAAIEAGEVDAIELLYVHNRPESVNVTRELQTAASHLKRSVGQAAPTVIARELGASTIEHLFLAQDSQIAVKEAVDCPAGIQFEEAGPKWKAAVLTVPGSWLRDLFQKHGDALFSANYRGFLGITRRRRINTEIKSTAEKQPENFWAYNNGVTLLTLGLSKGGMATRLTGISIINGAQTTGSIGSVDPTSPGLDKVKVLCRAIICDDADTISEIIKYNNTQNEITTWDQYSNDPEQARIAQEFLQLGHSYSRKRGFRPLSGQIGIEDVAQPLVSFHGRFRDANSGKNRVFERRPLYTLAFNGKKARHILLVHTLALAIDERRLVLKGKSSDGSIIRIEDNQLRFLRNLRFKQFFIALVARVLDNIVGFRCDRETIAFSPSAAELSAHSVVALTAAWAPVVETILTFATASLDHSTFTDFLATENAVDVTVEKVSALLYASRDSLPIGEFKGLLSPS